MDENWEETVDENGDENETESEDVGLVNIDPLQRWSMMTVDGVVTIDECPDGPEDGYFYVPICTNYSSVDLFVPEKGLMIQITMGQKIGVKWNEI